MKDMTRAVDAACAGAYHDSVSVAVPAQRTLPPSGFPARRFGARIRYVPSHHPHPAVRWRPKSPGQGHPVHARAAQQPVWESVLIRSAAEAKIREGDRLECEAWHAIMWAGGPAMPSPGGPQAEPTIGKAINGGYDLLEAKCNRCDRVSLVALRALKQPLDTPVWKLEAALCCEPCSEGRHYSRRQRAHIMGLTYAPPDPELPRVAKQ